jgi:hypothetical protein
MAENAIEQTATDINRYFFMLPLIIRSAKIDFLNRVFAKVQQIPNKSLYRGIIDEQ